MKPVPLSTCIGGFALALSGLALAVPGVAEAQTRTTRDTATAYGARLTSKGTPANLNQNRINNRIDNRIENRIGLRIERYRVDSTNNPMATLRGPQDDKSRSAPVIDPLPMKDGPE